MQREIAVGELAPARAQVGRGVVAVNHVCVSIVVAAAMVIAGVQ